MDLAALFEEILRDLAERGAELAYALFEFLCAVVRAASVPTLALGALLYASGLARGLGKRLLCYGALMLALGLFGLRLAAAAAAWVADSVARLLSEYLI